MGKNENNLAREFVQFYKALQNEGMPEERAFEMVRLQFIMILQKSLGMGGPNISEKDISKLIEKMLGLDPRKE